MVGRTLLHYRILAPLGAGGMGQVYLAFDERQGREVALKLLPPRVGDDRGRLRREAAALIALRHPNVVSTLALEEHEGKFLLVMEKVDGVDLATRVRAGGLATEAFFALALPLTAAVAAAHGRGILHRDLKPGNVMVGAGGALKVLDFALGEGRGPEPDGKTATDVPNVVGTLPYMPPEVVEGRSVDARSDVFSLGILLHELATGQRPYQAENVTALMVAILRNQRQPCPYAAGLPAGLPALLDRCLAPKKADRFADAGALHAALTKVAPAPGNVLGRLWAALRRQRAG